MFPPHLPPPFSDIARHRQWERLKLILVSSTFGVIAGLSGAAMLVGWVWPSVINNDDYLFNSNAISAPREQIRLRAQNKIVDKMFSVYQKSTALSKANYFSESDRVGEGVMSVTSGWLVMYNPKFDGKISGWLAVAENGSIYSVAKSLFDKRSGVVYLKIEPRVVKPGVTNEQFKVATFSEALKQYDELFVFQDGRWNSTMTTGQVSATEVSHLDSASSYIYNLVDSFKDGSVVIDVSGNMVGFVVHGSAALSLVNENYFLNGINEKTQIVYPSLGVEGWYGDEKLIIINEEKISGFIVSRVLGNRQIFQKGDIILEINGRPMNRENLWSNINEQRVRISLLRNGEIVENQVSIIELQ
jgi:hypothetical protein